MQLTIALDVDDRDIKLLRIVRAYARRSPAFTYSNMTAPELLASNMSARTTGKQVRVGQSLLDKGIACEIWSGASLVWSSMTCCRSTFRITPMRMREIRSHRLDAVCTICTNDMNALRQ